MADATVDVEERVTGTEPAEAGDGMELRPTAEVSLLVDVGTAWSKASVVGRARGRWRVVAHAAQPSNWGEAALLATLSDRLRAGADPRLVDELDAILAGAPRIACHTPVRPGRIAIAAVTNEISGAAARRAAESGGWVVVALVAADDGRSLPERLSVLAAAEVDAWLVVGGFDASRPEQALEAAGMVAAARGGGSSPVVWAGSAVLAEEVASLFEPGIVQPVANPRPTAGEESLGPLRHHLEELLDRLVESAGTRNLAPIGFRRAVAQVARADRLRVGAVDLGARYATWVFADGRGDPVIPESRVFASGGISSPTLVAPGAAGRLVRLLDLPVDELAVADTLQNMRSRPGTLPYSDEDLAVTRAAAQVLLGALAEERGGEALDLLIGAGRIIAAAPTPMHAMQLLLDGVRPVGVTQIALDVAGILGPLGSLSDDELREGVGMLRDDLLTPLGTAVVVRGGRSGQPAMAARLHRAGWPDPEPVEVRSGQVVVLPLPRGERAELHLDLAGGITLPGARRAHHLSVEVTGGTVGLVLDARDVPAQLPRRLDDRRAVLAGWREILLGEPIGRERRDRGGEEPHGTAGERPPPAARTPRWRPRAGFLRNVRGSRGYEDEEPEDGDETPSVPDGGRWEDGMTGADGEDSGNGDERS